MWWLGSILFVIIWIAIAFWPARVAARKGHTFFLYFLFSLVFFPLRSPRRVHGGRPDRPGPIELREPSTCEIVSRI